MSISEHDFKVALAQFEAAEKEQPDVEGQRFLWVSTKLRKILLRRVSRYTAKRKWQRGAK